jgi:hypothetical protein
MSIITPQEYNMNIHQIPDIENNMLEVMKKKLQVYDERLVKVEKKIWDNFKDENKCVKCVSDWFIILESVGLWTIVILLWKKVGLP